MSARRHQLAPPAQWLAAGFSTDPCFDNPRAAQIRLPGFNIESPVELGGRVRDCYAAGSSAPDRVDQFPDFDPWRHYVLTLISTEMTDTERNATRADDIFFDG